MEATGQRSQHLQAMLKSVLPAGPRCFAGKNLVFDRFAIGCGRKMDFGLRLSWNAGFSVDFSSQSLSPLL